MQRLIPSGLRLFLLILFCLSGIASAQTTDDSTTGADQTTEEAPVKKGKLRIKSSPAGAKVWIDHVEVGRTPLEVSLPAGKHQVRISKDRFQPHNVTVKVVAHRVRPINVGVEKDVVRWSLIPISRMRSSPSKQKFETFPLRLKSLKEATYQYRVTAPGYEPLSGEFTWKKGKNVYIWLKLESSLGRFVVNTTPPGSTVWLDGEEVGVTPLELKGVSQAKHVVHVKQKGFADLIRIVDTSDGSTGELDVKLANKGAHLIVWTGSKEGALMVEGVPIGEGRRISFPKLEKGKYEVEIQAPNKDREELDSRPQSRICSIPWQFEERRFSGPIHHQTDQTFLCPLGLLDRCWRIRQWGDDRKRPLLASHSTDPH